MARAANASYTIWPQPWASVRAATLAARPTSTLTVEGGRFASMADLARFSGMSSTRAQQLLNLLELHPEILEEIEGGAAEGVSEPVIRKIARMRDQKQQLTVWRARVTT